MEAIHSSERLQPPAHAGSSLADFSTLKMEAIHSSERLQPPAHAGSSLVDFSILKMEAIHSSERLQPPAHAGSSLADFSTLKMEAIRSSETSVHTRSTRRHIPEDGILHSHRRENLKCYMVVPVDETTMEQ
jgi:hypothetical protein